MAGKIPTLTGVGLDSSNDAPERSPIDRFWYRSNCFEKSAGGSTHHTKTAIVVDGIRIIVVALRGTAIPRIVVPGAAPFGLPTHKFILIENRKVGKNLVGCVMRSNASLPEFFVAVARCLHEPNAPSSLKGIDRFFPVRFYPIDSLLAIFVCGFALYGGYHF
jgi:hypothetical protein